MEPTRRTFHLEELSVDERLRLLEEIWESLSDASASFEVTTAQCQELDRRLAAHAAAPGRGSTWEQVKARLLGS